MIVFVVCRGNQESKAFLILSHQEFDTHGFNNNPKIQERVVSQTSRLKNATICIYYVIIDLCVCVESCTALVHIEMISFIRMINVKI